MADRTLWMGGVPILLHDNGDGTYAIGTSATLVGGGDASASNQDEQSALLTTLTTLVKAIAGTPSGSDASLVPLFVRDDALGTLAEADGKYTYGRVNDQGAQWVTMATALSALVDSIQSMPIPGLTTYVHKDFTYTSAQTGTAVWTPTSGKKFIVTGGSINFGGTTAGNANLWCSTSGSADTSYTAGTDRSFFRADVAPSSTVKPGAILSGQFWVGHTVDYPLRLTTDAGVTVYGSLDGYEV